MQSTDEIFGRLPDMPPTKWAEHYRRGPAFRKFVRTREHTLGLDTIESTADADEGMGVQRSALANYLTLTKRYAKVKLRDAMGTAVLLAQAPILALAMWIVFKGPTTSAMFVMAFAAVWFGASAAVRELIADRTIWRREHRVGLGLIPYMASKITVLGALVAVQCSTLAVLLWLFLGMGGDYSFNLPLLALVMTATGLTGTALGLAMSSVFNSSEAAVGTLPITIIPQLVFGGLIVYFKDMPVFGKVLASLMNTRYAFEAAIKCGDSLLKPGEKGLDDSDMTINGILWMLGFRTNAADDMGLSMLTLLGILVAFFVVFTAVATWFTRRAARGN